VQRGKKAVLFDDIGGTRQRYRPVAQTSSDTKCERRALHGWNSADIRKKSAETTEILFGRLVLDWRGDSLRLVN
jgi:hypothetical protein